MSGKSLSSNNRHKSIHGLRHAVARNPLWGASLTILAALASAPAVAATFSPVSNFTASDTWFNAGNWTGAGGLVPNNGGGNDFDATVQSQGIGAYTITTGAPISLNSLTVDDPNVTIDNSGQTLTTVGSVTVHGGTILGGTVQTSGSTTALAVADGNGGTLDGVTLNGSLDLTGNYVNVTVRNGLTVNKADGTSPGEINLSGYASRLNFDNSGGPQTLDNANVHLASFSSIIYAGGGNTLTIGSGVTVSAESAFNAIGGDGTTDIVNNGGLRAVGGHTLDVGQSSYYVYAPTHDFTNNGIVLATDVASVVNVNASNNVTNNGTIQADSGAVFNIGSGGGFINSVAGQIIVNDSGAGTISGAFTNAGTISANGAGNPTILQLGTVGTNSADPGAQWSNTGTINATDADVRLGGYITTPLIGTINRTGGSITLNGYLDNTGQTLDIGAGSATGLTLSGGTILNGTVQTSGSTTALAVADGNGGTLDGVTLNGSLDLTGNYVNVTVRNGLTVNKADGTSPGEINLSGYASQLNFDTSVGDQTLDNVNVHMTGGADSLTGNGGNTLTIGANATVASESGENYVGYSPNYGYGTANLVNNGALKATGGSGLYAYLNNNFTNNGTVLATDPGSNVIIQSNAGTNNGTIQADSGASLNLYNISNSATGQIIVNDSGSGSIGGAFTNEGTISVNGAGNPTSLQLGSQGASADPSYQWNNTGTINATDADLKIGGYTTTANIGTINRTGGTETLNGYLDNTGATLDIGVGSTAGLTLSGGTILGGTVQTSGSTTALAVLDNSGGTLDGVTVKGSLDLGNYSSVTVRNGLTVQQADGGAPGEIHLNGYSANLTFDNSTGDQTLDNVNVHMTGGNDNLQTFDYGNSHTLTIGSNATVASEGGEGNSINGVYWWGGDNLVNNGVLKAVGGNSLGINLTNITNNGTLLATDAGSSVSVYSYFGGTNNGTIQADSGASLTTYNMSNGATGQIIVNDGGMGSIGGAFTNAGTISANGAGNPTVLQLGNAGTSRADPGAQWSNTGTINATDADVRLGGYITTPLIGTINRTGGSITLNGYLDNTGHTLDIGAGSATGLSLSGGTILNGTVQASGSTTALAVLDNNGGTLDGVTLNGSLDLGNSSQVTVRNGLTVHQADGSAPGDINMNGFAAGLTFDHSSGDQTLVNVAVHMTGGQNSIVSQGYPNSGALTIGSGATVASEGGGTNYIYGNNYWGADTLVNNGVLKAVGGNSLYVYEFSSLTNNGTIQATDPGSNVSVYSYNRDTNNGTLRADDGATVLVGQQLTNLSGGTLTGGTYEAHGTGQVQLASDVPISTLAANVVLNGAGSTVMTYDPTFGSDAAIDDSLTAIASGGTLHVENGRVFTPTANGSNFTVGTGGQLVLDQGGAFNAASLTNSGSIYGNGTIGSTIANSGSVGSGDGTLYSGAINGSGTIQTEANSTLDLTGATTNSSASTLANNGSINLGSHDLTVASDYTNANFGTGNAFDARANVSGSGKILAASATQTLSGDGLVNGDTQLATLNLANVHVGETVHKVVTISNDGTTTILRGAVKDSAAPGVSVAGGQAWAAGPGGSTTFAIDYTATTAGLGGQYVEVVNNFDNVADQKLALSGAAYRLAQASAHAPEPVVLANVRVGGTASQTLGIANTAVNDGYSEKLDASIAPTTGAATANGSFNLLAAGSVDNSGLHVGIDTSSAGHKTGTATITLTSDGAGTSGLGTTALDSQTVNVSGDVYRVAVGSATPSPIVLANQHIGGGATQSITVQNTAAGDGYSEKLNASFGANGGAVSNNGGSVSLLTAQASDSSLAVGIDTSAAGHKSGTATLNYQSDGAGTSGLSAIAAGSQTINVSGDVYRYAVAGVFEPVVLSNQHVGDALVQGIVISNDATPDAFSESLNAAVAGVTGAANASGSVNGLSAGIQDFGASMNVGVDSSSAGHKAGTAVIAFASDGAGTSELGITSLGTKTVNVSGDVYRLASASAAAPNPVTIVNQHVGDGSVAALTISNTAVNDGFSEALNAGIGGQSGNAIGGGAVNLLSAGASDSGGLTVGVDTSSAGHKTGVVTIALASDGAGTSELGMTGLASQNVAVSGDVYNLASSSVIGAINFGLHHVGDGPVTQAIAVTNTAPTGAFSEGLDSSFGSFTGAGGSKISTSGSITNLTAGATDSSSLKVILDTSTVGVVNGNLTVHQASNGTISGLGNTALADQNPAVTADVQNLGTVVRYASPLVNNAPVNFANARVGDSLSQALTITNNVPNDGFSELLNGSIAGQAGAASSNGGSFSGLVAGNSDNGSIVVGLDTSSAGAKSGNVTLNFKSDGTIFSGGAVTDLGNQNVSVSGNVYRVAVGNATPSPVVLSNQHVGGGATQAITVQNTAVNDGYSESLNAAFGANGGAVSNNGGSISLLAAQGSDSSLAVGIDTSSAGHKSGTATVNYQSDGTGTSGLSAISAGSQTINVSGDVYRLASASDHTPESVVIANQHVGGGLQQTLTIANTAINDGFSESLTASLGGLTGNANGTGAFSLLAAGTSDNSSLKVGVDTSSAGHKAGTATISLTSDGAGTSGLGTTGLASQDVTVSGDVYRLAVASAHTPEPVNLGNVRIGGSASQALTLANAALNDGYSEKLDASLGGASAGITASGAVNLLAAGASDTSSLVVGLDTSTAGHKSGTATITLTSDGTGTSGLGSTALGTQTVDVSGDVYRLANPNLNTGSVSLAARVGDIAPSAGVSVTNASPDVYTEGLKASLTDAPAGITTSGAIANLAAGNTDASTLTVGLDTSVAGTYSGNVTAKFTSIGAGTDNAADLALADGSVGVTGKVYAKAVADVTPSIDFGIVHKGDVVSSRAVTVGNNASGALTDTLVGGFGGISSPFSGSGNLGAGVAAGSSDSSSLSVGLNTSSAGVYVGTAALNLASHNADLADAAVAAGPVALTGQVNEYAKAAFEKTSGAGAFSGAGSVYSLDLGITDAGSGPLSSLLDLVNDVIGFPVDTLSGTFDIAGSGFNLTGFSAVNGLQGGDQWDLGISIDPSAIGEYSQVITFHGVGSNASGYSGSVGDVTLNLHALVRAAGSASQVPEPGLLGLFGLGLGSALILRRRKGERLSVE